MTKASVINIMTKVLQCESRDCPPCCSSCFVPFHRSALINLTSPAHFRPLRVGTAVSREWGERLSESVCEIHATSSYLASDRVGDTKAKQSKRAVCLDPPPPMEVSGEEGRQRRHQQRQRQWRLRGWQRRRQPR